jgi:mannose-1-phosphate guanylyltransferase
MSAAFYSFKTRNNIMILPVIMAGGTGSRLWPMSRELFPKQFLTLYGSESMLQATVNRLDGLDIANPVVICNEEHRFIVAEQLREINRLSQNIILEPMGRNTAPAIALAALHAVKDGEDPIMLVLAADHVINNVDIFHKAIDSASYYANRDHLVTFGIVPASPETGYGYIQRGDSLNVDIHPAFRVRRFVEKPNKETAQEYVDSRCYYWNSGMFMFKASKYLHELEKYRPDILTACKKSLKISDLDMDFIRVDKESFNACPDESIDYAVMEHTDNAVVVPLDADWSDVGSWSALWDISDKDADNNAFTGDVYLSDSHDCYINTDEKLVAAVGVDNLVIVNTKDAVLVVDKSKVQDVKKIVEFLKKQKRSEFRSHRTAYRPWGTNDTVVSEARFKVSHIKVKPGGAFSLQIHHHRAEHWVVLSGTARVCVGDKSFLITENQSTFIPVGVAHTLENPGKIPLEMIEVQSGSYLNEDDIIRLKDQYGRC